MITFNFGLQSVGQVEKVSPSSQIELPQQGTSFSVMQLPLEQTYLLQLPALPLHPLWAPSNASCLQAKLVFSLHESNVQGLLSSQLVGQD